MLIEEIKEKFEIGQVKNEFRRINESFKGNVFVGYSDDLPTIIIKEKSNQVNIESSKYIITNIKKVENGHVYLSFQLLDLELYDIFLKFCEDLILNIEYIEKNQIIKYAIERWNLWKKVFRNKSNKLLDEIEIMGLIGELLFLKKYMMERFNNEYSIDSWNGPEKGCKDFEFSNEWFEIKTKSRTKNEITISSLEQLDSDLVGNLIVISLEKNNRNIENSINLNNLVDEIFKSIESYETTLKLKDKLLKYGYIKCEEYDEFNYSILNEKRYIVSKEFPRIKKNLLPKGIIKVSYTIDLATIEMFKMGDSYGYSRV